MIEVWKCVEQLHMLESGDRVLLGVSGGPDSMALLHLLYSRREYYGIQLFVVHVNHQLRPEAEEEAGYVEQYCKQLGIPFRLFTVDVSLLAAQKGLSLEQAGHEVRHACFAEAADTWRITKLALGHHRDDRAESLLLHLIQGCGLDGLSAMPPREGWLIRPLAQVSKAQLVAYCQEQGLHYFIDSTNLEAGCLRNRIRLELLPQLRQYNSQITDALLRLQETSGADADYLEQCTECLWQQYGTVENGSVIFPAQEIKHQHVALQRRILRRLYRQLTGSEADLNFRQVEQMRHVALQQHGSQQVSLAGGIQFSRCYDQLLVNWSKPVSAAYCYEWEYEQPFWLPEWSCQFIAVIEKFVPKKNGKMVDITETSVSESTDIHITVDADRLCDRLQIRSRVPGDKLTTAQGHKTLKKFFIDKKVPATIRNQLPLVISGKEIIWIPGYYLADCIKINSDTKRICRFSCIRKIFS